MAVYLYVTSKHAIISDMQSIFTDFVSGKVIQGEIFLTLDSPIHLYILTVQIDISVAAQNPPLCWVFADPEIKLKHACAL